MTPNLRPTTCKFCNAVFAYKATECRTCDASYAIVEGPRPGFKMLTGLFGFCAIVFGNAFYQMAFRSAAPDTVGLAVAGGTAAVSLWVAVWAFRKAADKSPRVEWTGVFRQSTDIDFPGRGL